MALYDELPVYRDV